MAVEVALALTFSREREPTVGNVDDPFVWCICMMPWRIVELRRVVALQSFKLETAAPRAGLGVVVRPGGERGFCT